MRKLKRTFVAILAIGVAFLGAAPRTFAQEPNASAGTIADYSKDDRSALEQVSVAGGDVESLIDNLSGGAEKVLRIRVFSAGQVLDYPEAMTAVQRDSGILNLL